MAPHIDEQHVANFFLDNTLLVGRTDVDAVLGLVAS